MNNDVNMNRPLLIASRSASTPDRKCLFRQVDLHSAVRRSVSLITSTMNGNCGVATALEVVGSWESAELGHHGGFGLWHR